MKSLQAFLITPVHLVTISRVLPGTLEATDLRDISGMSRKDIALCVQLSFDDPVATLGRPRTQAVGGVVQKMVVFQEAHADWGQAFPCCSAVAEVPQLCSCKDNLADTEPWQHTSQASICNSGLQSVMATCQHWPSQ